MREIIIILLVLAVPLIPWAKVFQFCWSQFKDMIPGAVDEFDTLLRKKWSMLETRHLFLGSCLLILISVGIFLLGALFSIPTLPLPVGLSLGLLAPFLVIYLIKPNIEAGFLFEVRYMHAEIKVQLAAGATPYEALSLVAQRAVILKSDIEEILLVWGNPIDQTLQKIANKYATDELNVFLTLIHEMNQAGHTNVKEVMQAFDQMKETMEIELLRQEEAKDAKEMKMLEIFSFFYVIALIFFMIVPVVGDVVRIINQLA